MVEQVNDWTVRMQRTLEQLKARQEEAQRRCDAPPLVGPADRQRAQKARDHHEDE